MTFASVGNPLGVVADEDFDFFFVVELKLSFVRAMGTGAVETFALASIVDEEYLGVATVAVAVAGSVRLPCGA